MSIGFGGAANIMGIWARTKAHWRWTSVVMMLANLSAAVYMAYETEWHVQAEGAQAILSANNPPTFHPDTRQIWVLVFGWIGVICHTLGSITCLVANQQEYRKYEVNED